MQLRWRPLEVPLDSPLDFIDGLYTVCGAGSSFLRHGYAVHMFVFFYFFYSILYWVAN